MVRGFVVSFTFVLVFAFSGAQILKLSEQTAVQAFTVLLLDFGFQFWLTVYSSFFLSSSHR